MRILYAVFLFHISVNGFSQESTERTVAEDLKKGWLFFSDGSFRNYTSTATKAQKIYFNVDPKAYREQSYLEIGCAAPFSFYLNFKLIAIQSRSIRIDLDSLQKRIPGPWLFGVHHSGGLPWLKTIITSPVEYTSSHSNSLRPSYHYLNFSIITSLILLISFAALLQSNPRLTFDYFNFARLFSIQEREDTLLNSRISASVNILYYIFCSFLAGFLLLTIFHFGENKIAPADSFAVHSLGQGFWQWIKLSFIVMLALIAKLILLSGLAQLFNFREAIGPQFYNYVRLFFFIFVVSSAVCLCYFVFKIQSPEAYSFLLGGIIFLLILWTVIIGLKLLSKSPFRFFHLFSYLCASELIPVVILVKLLNS